MNKFLYKLQSKLFTFIGDIGWSGWRHPFWLTFNLQSYQVKGEHYALLKELLQPGDILIRRFEGYLDRFFIPGWWNHGGVYVGGKDEQIVHAISDGVVIEHVINFLRTDHLIVLRPPDDMCIEGLARARSVIGYEYDFSFDFSNAERFSCTEFVDFCYPQIIKPKKRFGRSTIVADDIVSCSQLTVIWDSREPMVQTLSEDGSVGRRVLFARCG